jgi:hypothetical protein
VLHRRVSGRVRLPCPDERASGSTSDSRTRSHRGVLAEPAVPISAGTAAVVAMADNERRSGVRVGGVVGGFLGKGRKTTMMMMETRRKRRRMRRDRKSGWW